MERVGHVLMNKAFTVPRHRLLPLHFIKNHPTLSSNYYDCYYHSESGNGSGRGGEGADEEIRSGLERSSAEQGEADGESAGKADFIKSDPWGNGKGDTTTNKEKKMGYQQSDGEIQDLRKRTGTHNPHTYDK